MLSSSFRYIHPLLAISDDVQRKIFPDMSLSVLAFLQFPIPNISGAASQHDALKFFSNREPNMKDIEEIQKVPVPPDKTVAELITACKTAITSGTMSIKCLHVPSGTGRYLPMWIIAYWVEVLELCTTS